MTRSEALWKAAIVRDGSRTYLTALREEVSHDSVGVAKSLVRRVCFPKGSGKKNGPPTLVCVTGKGAIAQMKKLHRMVDEQERIKKEAEIKEAAEKKLAKRDV